MLRIINNLKSLSLEIAPFTASTVNVNSVRWRRKPRKPIWKGTAKSKIFRVPTRPKIPEEEALELQRLYNKYRTELKTIKQFLTSKYNVENQQQEDQDLKRREFEADLENCMKLNDEWNVNQKVLREARAAAEMEVLVSQAEQRKIVTQEKREQRIREFNEMVKKEKGCSVEFITPEKLDAAIENALANPVDHNFALDLEGNVINGRETVPPTPQKNEAIVKQ